MANRIKGITVEIGGDTTEQLQNGEISQEQYDVYSPFQVNHLHGQTEPVPRRMRATLTETEPVLFDVNYQATAC